MPSQYARYKHRVINRLTFHYDWSKDDALPWCNANIDYIRQCMVAKLAPIEVAKLFDDAKKEDDGVR